MIHVYAVVDGLRELPNVRGLGDAPLESQRVDDLELVYSRAPSEVPEATEGAIMRHAEVIEGLMAGSDAILPMQFGHAFTDEEDVARAVGSRSSELGRGLARVRGCVEFGLRLLLPAEPGDGQTPASGSEYMRVRLAGTRTREQLADAFHEPLARHARASTRFRDLSPGNVLAAAYLVPAGAVDAFRDEVRRLESEQGDAVVVCTGPWPPYSFTSVTEEDV